MPAALAPSLAALIAPLDPPVVEVVPVSTLMRGRGAFQLLRADGSRLKARLTLNEQRARQIEQLRRRLPEQGFSRVLARLGNALLEEWVQGRAPDDPPSGQLLQRCGDLLGQAHRSLPQAAIARPIDDPVTQHRQRLHQGLRRLVDAGQLALPQARALVALAGRRQPAAASVGLLHHDFCADNLLIGADGLPVAIDNGSLRVGCHDLDLARTWYLWPMSASQRRHFLDAYDRHRSSALFLQHRPFWLACVLTSSALVRLGIGADAVVKPLAAMQQLLAEPDQGSSTQ